MDSVNVGLGRGRWAVSQKLKMIQQKLATSLAHSLIVSPCPGELASRLLLTELTRLGEPKCVYGEKSTLLRGYPAITKSE